MSDASPGRIVGKHVLADLHGCDAAALDDEPRLVAHLRASAEAAGATVLSVSSHRFEPAGVTAIALLSESHLSIHTWPERGYAAVDAFTCGSHTDPETAVRMLSEALGAERATTTVHARGDADER